MHIKQLGLHNVYKDGETSTLKFDTQLTILTGYNGSGKTSALEIIHSTLSMISGQKYQFAKSNWGCEITLADSTKIFHAKIARPIKENFKPSNVKFNKSVTSSTLASYYDKIFRETTDPSEQSDTIVVKEGTGRPDLSTNIISIARNPSREKVTLSSTLYCDELFNAKEQEYESKKLEDLDIFSKNKNLDKTLLLLIKDFSNESPTYIEHFVPKDWKKLMGQFENMENLISTTNFEIKKLRELIVSFESLTKHQTESDSDSDSKEEFITEANKFFSNTHRKIFINQKNLLALKTRRGEVQWYDFSKGEKTLLCLLLAAHLNRAKEKVFLLDEPDLSLHINWQKQLLPSLLRLAPKAQFIVATHSPALVGRCDNEKIINIAQLAKV